MRYKASKKPPRSSRLLVAVLVAWSAGGLEGLLIARLVARALAARPDSPAFTVLYSMTEPFVTPLAALNIDLPPHGAAVEPATLVTAMLVPLIAVTAWLMLTHDATRAHQSPSNRGDK